MKNSNVYLQFHGYGTVEGFTHLSAITIVPEKGRVMQLSKDFTDHYADYFKDIDLDQGVWYVSNVIDQIDLNSHSIYLTIDSQAIPITHDSTFAGPIYSKW